MSYLNDLGNKYGTDKGTIGKGGPKKGHGYLDVYERYLSANREEVRRVLEIGVKLGASIRTWEEYFPNAHIYGLDIKDKALKLTGPRITTRIVDQSDSVALEQFADEFGPFDFVVDDGSHVWAHQIITLQTLLKHVAPGGRYIIEDLDTSFFPEFGHPGQVTGVQYVLRCVEKVLCGKRVPTKDPFLSELHHKVETVTVMRNAAIFVCR